MAQKQGKNRLKSRESVAVSTNRSRAARARARRGEASWPGGVWPVWATSGGGHGFVAPGRRKKTDFRSISIDLSHSNRMN